MLLIEGDSILLSAATTLVGERREEVSLTDVVSPDDDDGG